MFYSLCRGLILSDFVIVGTNTPFYYGEVKFIGQKNPVIFTPLLGEFSHTILVFEYVCRLMKVCCFKATLHVMLIDFLGIICLRLLKK